MHSSASLVYEPCPWIGMPRVNEPTVDPNNLIMVPTPEHLEEL